MKIVFENEFLKMNFDGSNDFMETVWTTTVMMGREKYREILKLYLEQLQTNHPKKLLINSVNAEYPITPEDQDWINIHIYPQTAEAGIKKIAFLVGTDLFMNISLEQVAEDSQKSVDKQIEQMFFDNYESALNWLNK